MPLEFLHRLLDGEWRRLLKDVREGEPLPFEDAVKLLDEVHLYLDKVPSLVDVSKDRVVFVGDTHGDFEASLKVIERYGKDHVLIFLGDYVDRGEKQLENVNLLLAEMIERKGRLVLLRGNHESPPVNYRYGFFTATMILGNSGLDAYTKYNEVLCRLPYAARVRGLLALHGGIAEGLTSLKQLSKLRRGDCVPTNRVAFEILWNDPSEEVEEFGPSVRGEGVKTFGRKPLRKFLKRTGLKGVVRSHQKQEDGFKFFFREETGVDGMEGLLLNIFTCRYYGVPRTVAVYEDGRLRVETLD